MQLLRVRVSVYIAARVTTHRMRTHVPLSWHVMLVLVRSVLARNRKDFD